MIGSKVIKIKRLFTKWIRFVLQKELFISFILHVK